MITIVPAFCVVTKSGERFYAESLAVEKREGDGVPVVAFNSGGSKRSVEAANVEDIEFDPSETRKFCQYCERPF